MEYRIIFYHKHSTSARTRFMLFNEQSVCYPCPFPKLAQLCDEQSDNTVLHPAAILKQIEAEWGLDPDTLKAEGEYQHRVDVPGEEIQIILASIETINPPFEVAEGAGAKFIDLTQARQLPKVELELLRFAYEFVLGG
ncbi:hypothetical protein [Solemya velesiana gill symbiont]|uniref:Nudix hydrolase domain-containing protein n=1 Tax=Solemya velesiana gill symbiont TaxID=1918948 RepID=A0A1T2KVT6_9GAMM|nr:hypothetical protein [Solemya velesiana gill symbiont]OOZ36836.1 hypothetical protein BOW51_05115 [Solemya velesiana gill symbiont]